MMKDVPAPAKWLGVAGLIPFVALAVLPLLNAVIGGSWGTYWFFALDYYAAVILSFLGGAHWGFILAGHKDGTESRIPVAALALSTMPPLVAWIALLSPMLLDQILPTALRMEIILAAGFLAMLAMDRWAVRAGYAPHWWFRLRWPLTLVAVLMIVFGDLLTLWLMARVFLN